MKSTSPQSILSRHHPELEGVAHPHPRLSLLGGVQELMVERDRAAGPDSRRDDSKVRLELHRGVHLGRREQGFAAVSGVERPAFGGGDVGHPRPQRGRPPRRVDQRKAGR